MLMNPIGGTRIFVVARLARVRKDLDDVTDRISQEMIPWAPRVGMRTVGGQLVEIAQTEMEIVAMLREGRTLDEKEAKATIGDCESLDNLVSALARVRGATLAYIASLSDEDIEGPVAIPPSWFESLGLESVPRSEILVSIAMHEWYHVGQLVSYLWTRGDDPYKW